MRARLIDMIARLSARVSALEEAMTGVKADVAEMKEKMVRIDDVVQVLEKIYMILIWVSRTIVGAILYFIGKAVYDHFIH